MAPLQRLSSGAQTANQLQIQHFIHQHLLHKINMTSEFSCDGCNTSGHSVRYHCSACDFDMHEQCATSPHRISSHHHPQHQLILVNRPRDSHVCHVCRGVTNGLSYMCESQTCEFNVHILCIQIPPATGLQPLASDSSQLPGAVSWGQSTATTVLGGSNQPMMVNHQMQGMQLGGHNGLQASQQSLMVNHQQKQVIATTPLDGYHGVNNNPTQMINHQQGIPMTGFGGNHAVNNSQPVMVNHQQQQQMIGAPTTAFDGNQAVNNSQPMMVNHQQQQQTLGAPMTAFGGNHGVNNSQPVMVNHHLQQQRPGVPTTAFGGYQGVNNNQTQMINHHHPQQQGIPPTGFGGHHGGMNRQPMMVNHHQNQQVIPTTALNTNQQLMSNHHQQLQQQQGIVIPAVGGYNVVNHNQTVMISHPPPPPPPPPPPQQSNDYVRMAANLVSTAFIGVPIFNSRN